MLLHRVHELVLGGVHPQVVDHEPGAAQHHDAQVLADVVEVALDRAHDDSAYRFDSRGGENGLDVGHPGLHGPGAGEDFRDEDEVLPELDAHDAHAGDQAVVHHLQRLDSVVQRRPGQRVDRPVVPIDQGRGDLLHGGRRPGESVDDPRPLVGSFDELFYFVLQKVVGYIV